MSVSIGVPQAIWLALALASLVLNCVNIGKEQGSCWWESALALAVNVALLWWGGFFS